tara:strand:+ start:183 stop:827 length:645 start_codon:yes stop_codon:yes gene_type:complete
MDEEISTINTITRNEKIKKYFIKNRKNIIILFLIFILFLISYFFYGEVKERTKIKIANQFENSKINFISGNKSNVENEMIEIINKRDKTYSPLALYFLIDNNIINSNEIINNFFDILINDIKYEKEVKNLIIYKKAIYNSSFENEGNLLKILNPLINSDSIWKSHGLYLMGEYFFSRNEKQKSKEFFEKILLLKNSNSKIKLEAQKRIQRDFSE